MRLLLFLIVFLMVAFGIASAHALDYYFTDRMNFPPGEARVHNQTITAGGNITITLPSGFTFLSSSRAYSQSGSNYSWNISSPTNFTYLIQSPPNCAEGTIYKSGIYENSSLSAEFVYVCVPDSKIVDFKVEYGHGCGNYLDYLYISTEPATLFNLLRVWNIGHYLTPDEDATDAAITCTYPDFTVRTYGRAEVDYFTGGVSAGFLWEYIEGGYWFRIGVISQDVLGLSVGDTYNVSCTELRYQFEHEQVIAPFSNYSIEIRSPEPFTITFENISGSASTAKVTINNTEKYPVFDIFFDRVVNGFQLTERLIQLNPGESVSYEIDKGTEYNFTVHFMPPWQKNCWSDYYSAQSFNYSEAIVDANPPLVTLSSPSNGATITNTYTVSFNVAATDNVGLANCTLYTNITGAWSPNETKSYSGTSDTDTWALNIGMNGTFIWNALCYDTSGLLAWHASNYTLTLNVTGTDSSPPVVTLIAPENNTPITASDDVALYASAEDDILLKECTVYTNMTGAWAANETKNFTGKYDADVWYLYNLSNGTYLWNVFCTDDFGNTGWGDANRTFSVSYSPGESQTVTQTVYESSRRTRYVNITHYVEVPVEVISMPDEALYLQILNYPKDADITQREFQVEAIVVNSGQNTLYNVLVEPDVSGGWSMDSAVIPRLEPGKAVLVNLTLYPKIICGAENMENLPLLEGVKYYLSPPGNISLRLVASSGGAAAYENALIRSFVPDMAVMTDSYDYLEGEVMTICIIVNNLGSGERDKAEFELELYDREKAYLADYLSSYTIENDSIFLLKKSYLLSYIPKTGVYPLNATLYEDGALFSDVYSTGSDSTGVLLSKGAPVEFAMPLPLRIDKWIARIALFLLLAAYLSMMGPRPLKAAASAAAAMHARAPPLTIGALCKKRVCGKKDICSQVKCKVPAGVCKKYEYDIPKAKYKKKRR